MFHASAAFVNYDMNYIPFNWHLHTDACKNVILLIIMYTESIVLSFQSDILQHILC